VHIYVVIVQLFSIPDELQIVFESHSLNINYSYELEPFNITTHTIEPAFFKTPICNLDYQRVGINERWKNINRDLQQTYGEEYKEKSRKPFYFICTKLK